MQYRFTSMDSLADYMANYSQNVLARVETASPREKELLKREAHTYMLVSHMLRDTVIVEKP